MSIPVMCIIQARYHSTRLPGKMLCELGGETLIARAHRLASEAFGAKRVVIAIPAHDPRELEEAVPGAQIFLYAGYESDLVARFYHCALRYEHTGVIHRWTPDDPFKDPACCRCVAKGETSTPWGQRYPVELAGEAFTFKHLCEAQAMTPPLHSWREHLSHNPWLFPTGCPDRLTEPGFTIDTQADLDAARARLAREGGR